MYTRTVPKFANSTALHPGAKNVDKIFSVSRVMHIVTYLKYLLFSKKIQRNVANHRSFFSLIVPLSHPLNTQGNRKSVNVVRSR